MKICNLIVWYNIMRKMSLKGLLRITLFWHLNSRYFLPIFQTDTVLFLFNIKKIYEILYSKMAFYNSRHRYKIDMSYFKKINANKSFNSAEMQLEGRKLQTFTCFSVFNRFLWKLHNEMMRICKITSVSVNRMWWQFQHSKLKIANATLMKFDANSYNINIVSIITLYMRSRSG